MCFLFDYHVVFEDEFRPNRKGQQPNVLGENKQNFALQIEFEYKK